MKRLLFSLVFCLSSFVFLHAQPRPKLVVGIVVDQMRWDYLYRYYNHYGDGGFKRLMRDGYRCEQTFINYLPTFTAPGHACIYTGSVPAIHGIAGNIWMEGGKTVYCTDDKTAKPVGGSVKWGQMSPRNMLTTTVGDELKLATSGRSRVYGVSLKDRSSILPAGHSANGAYWFDDSTGNFSTSTYYANELSLITPDLKYSDRLLMPKWVEDFNAKRWADTILSRDWNLYDDSATYTQSVPHNTRYEGRFDKSEDMQGFSHRAGYFKGSGATKYNNVRNVPDGNWLTLQFAKRCIAANKLGTKADPDFLAVSLSATDYIGHKFGPNSVEMEDTYIRLDAELARFFRFLDDKIGEGQYTVFLTADHGAAHNSLFLNDRNIPADNVSDDVLHRDLNAYIKKETGKDSVVVSMENYQVYFKPSNSLSVAAADNYKQLAKRWLGGRPEIAYVLDLQEPRNNAAIPELLLLLSANGYYAPRCGALQIILKPGYYAGYAPTGTTHGTWNPYDTHIPLLWWGWGIPKGETHREVHVTDIAATLSALLRIQMPNGCVGKVITEIVR